MTVADKQKCLRWLSQRCTLVSNAVDDWKRLCEVNKVETCPELEREKDLPQALDKVHVYLYNELKELGKGEI